MNASTSRGLLDTESKLTVIPRNSKHHLNTPVTSGAYRGQVNAFLVELQVTVGPLSL